MRVAIAQLSGPPDGGAASRARSVTAARDLLMSGADMVVLPELIVPGYSWNVDLVRSVAEPVNGETVTAWTTVAREFGGYVAGGFAERDNGAVYNTAVLVGPDGVVLHYRKLHLFAGEKEVFAPGDRGLPVVQTPHGRIALCVCYDLRFVETLRILSLRGAELVCVPTAWVQGFDQTGSDGDGFAPQARNVLVQANLNQVFVACASQAGEHGAYRFLGSSIIADPRGRCLAGPLAGNHDDRALAEVTLGEVAKARDRGGRVLPHDDRRSDVYSVVIDGQRL